MKQLNWFQNWVAKTVKIIDFDFEQALRDRWRDGDAHGYERGVKEKADCMACPLYRKDLINRQLQQQPPGRYAVYSKDMERKKFTTQKVDPTHTDILEQAPREFDRFIHGEQPHIRKYSLSRYDGLYHNETPHRTPAFLEDRKVS